MTAPNIIVTAPGSLGDVNPLLAIAHQLQHAGHSVLFLAAQRYLPLAERAGLKTRPLVTETQFQRLAGNPNLWHPRHGARLIFREAVEHFLQSHYRWLEQHCVPGQTVLVSHVLDFAGRVYRDAHPATKFVSVLPAPALLRSPHTPARLSSYFWERWIPRRLVPALYWCADQWLDHIGAGPINELRRSLGLASVQRILHRWWWSPDLVLCLFPQWYSIDPRDLLPQMRLVGFPLADSAEYVSPEVAQQTADLCHSFGDERPVVFAPGTAHEHAGTFLQSAAQACEQLKRPGVLISTNAAQIPSRLPPGVVAARYLPFSHLLPRSAAIVHHGGVGTTSQALRAGTPQVVVPMAFDQFDNAERVARLGCGSWLPMHTQNTARLMAHLQALPHSATRTAEVAQQLSQQPSAAELAVKLIESLIQKRDTSEIDR
jgi:rhamnosyltransferase subunit B